MSGICAVWKLNGAPVLKSEIDAMTIPMARRGPDGGSVWTCDNAGLGHRLLATTAEAAAEKMPLVHKERDVVITCDARLDNRDALIDKLNLKGVGRTPGDGEIILRSYLRWGDQCVDHLLGDFAFAIWDRSQQRMFCARDQAGMKQLLYSHQVGKLFACATDAESILALADVPRKINQARILDCLTDQLESVDKTSTMFEEIYRLPPAHTLTVTNARLQIQRYWTMKPPVELQLETDRDYQEAFREVFGKAVRARLRGGEIVGSMLSGGLDSGSVVACASGIRKSQGFGPLQTISAVGELGTGGDPETGTIEAMARLDGIGTGFVNLSDMDRLAPEVLKSLKWMREPFDGSMTMIRAVYQKARAQGLKVMLDGVGGDAAMDIGGYGKRLIRRGRFIDAWREMDAEHRFWGLDVSNLKGYFRMLISAYLSHGIRNAGGRIASRELARKLVKEVGISPEFASKHDLIGRLERCRSYRGLSSWQNPQLHAVRVFEHPNEVVARERYDRVAAEYGIETRDPFRDLRVMSFCASLPSSQKTKNGFPKYILRQAFADRFPLELKRRMGKEDLGWAFTKKVLDHAKTMESEKRASLANTLLPYHSTMRTPDLFCEDWFFLAKWIDGQNSK